MGKGGSSDDDDGGSEQPSHIGDVLSISFAQPCLCKTIVPVSLTSQELRAVLDKPLEVDSQVRLRVLTPASREHTLLCSIIWCKRIYDCLWEVGFEYADHESREQAASIQSLYGDYNPPQLDSFEEPASEEQPLRLEQISHEELGRLGTLARICEVFNSSVSVPQIMQSAMEILLESTGAQRCLLLIDRGHEVMDIPAACGEATKYSKSYSRTVVREVRSSGKPVISKDVDGDPRFKDAESLKSLGVRSILCVPVRTEERDFGLIYLDNALKAGVFTQKELQLAVVIGGLAASSLARAETFSQMIQGEKMAALGTMLTGTIHELNSPLTAILCLAEMLHREGDELTESLMVEARRCRNMVNQLLQTARTESETEAKFISLEEVVEHTLRLVRPELEAHAIELIYSEPESISEVKGNSDRFGQIILNLLFNAVYEVKNLDKGVIELRLYEQDGRVCLVVADNGRGIPAEDHQRVYDPFFTTKPAGEGTGMGLAVTHRLVKEHGGEIILENRVDGGAMFTVSFPAVTIGSLFEGPEAAG